MPTRHREPGDPSPSFPELPVAQVALKGGQPNATIFATANCG